MAALAMLVGSDNGKELLDPCDLDNHLPSGWVEINSDALSRDSFSIDEAKSRLQNAGVCPLDITSHTAMTFDIFYRAEIPLSQVSLATDNGWSYTSREQRVAALEEMRAYIEGKIRTLEDELTSYEASLVVLLEKPSPENREIADLKLDIEY